jgi:uncharacterized protein (TIGR02452 family)
MATTALTSSRSYHALVKIAQENLKIMANGKYEIEMEDGKLHQVDIQKELTFACNYTETILPEDSQRLLSHPESRGTGDKRSSKIKFQVIQEKTQVAAYNIVQNESLKDLLVLNFASAKNRGGGFLRGARAQEEDLCRCSALFACLNAPGASAYYGENARCRHLLYTDCMVYSPSVPFFRTDCQSGPLAEPFVASVITCPAPNALAKERDAVPKMVENYDSILHQRVGKILAVAEAKGHQNLLLGAWGCGVFHNDPRKVAKSFYEWLTSDRFSASFDNVIFAIYSPNHFGVVRDFQHYFDVEKTSST